MEVSPRGRQLKVTGQKKLTEKWNQSVYLHKANNSKNNSHSLIIRRTCEWEYPSLFSKSARIKQHFPRKATHPFFFFFGIPVAPPPSQSPIDSWQSWSVFIATDETERRLEKTPHSVPAASDPVLWGCFPATKWVRVSKWVCWLTASTRQLHRLTSASVLNAHTRFFGVVFFFFLNKTNKNAST